MEDVCNNKDIQNFCANCQELCPTFDSTIRELELYNSTTEEYYQVQITDALEIIFKKQYYGFGSKSPEKKKRRGKHQNSLRTRRNADNDNDNDKLCFCLNCKDLYMELIDAYFKFTLATSVGSYVFHLLSNESEEPQSTPSSPHKLDLDESEGLGPTIKVEVVDEEGEEAPELPDRDADVISDAEMLQYPSSSSSSDEPRSNRRTFRKRKVKKRNSKFTKTTKKSQKKVQMEEDEKIDQNCVNPEIELDPNVPEASQSDHDEANSNMKKRSYPYPVSPEPSEFKCLICPNDIFNSIQLWREHQQTVHEQCFPRGVKTYDKRRKGRVTKISMVDYYPCYICGKGIVHPALKAHIDKVHTQSDPVVCSVCGKELKNKATLEAHMRGMHEEVEVKKFMCSICGLKFKAKVNLSVHEATHRSELKPESKRHRFECSVCQEKFDLQCRLRRHQSKHSNERPYKCTKCDSSYKDRLHLMNHLRLHRKREEMAEECEICGKRFSLKSRVKDHLIGVHKLSVEEAKIKSKVNIRHVVRIEEENEKEFQEKRKKRLKPSTTCKFCSKKYSRREYLTTHLISTHNISKEEAFILTGIDTKRDILATACQKPSPMANNQLSNQSINHSLPIEIISPGTLSMHSQHPDLLHAQIQNFNSEPEEIQGVVVSESNTHSLYYPST